MQKLIYKGAINPLSFGNVSYNLIREMYKLGLNVSFFPIGDNLNFESFDKVDEDFKNWIISSAQNRFNTVDKETPTLTQWHINGSENRLSKDQTLFTFYEVDEPTATEKSLVNLQDNCIFSSKHAADSFKKIGCQNVSHVPIGFDEDFHNTEEDYLPNKIHFGLMGKFENRKNTEQILKNWAEKYGNNYDYQLSCCINNPFFKPEQMNQLIARALNGQHYGNINFIPHLKTNSEVNEFLNAIDIDLTGLSGAEGWNIPAFNATSLGKWSVVMNHTSHKDWATDQNSILVEPEYSQPIYDQAFFTQGAPFNQGSMNKISDDTMLKVFEKSEKFKGKSNKEGVKLKSKFTYKNTLESILNIIENEK